MHAIVKRMRLARRPGWAHALTVVIAFGAAGCATAPARPPTNPTPAGPRVVEMEPVRFEKAPSGEVTLVDAERLLAAANQQFTEGKYEDAIGTFLRLQREFPESKLRAAALYNQGLAHEKVNQLDQAIACYRQLPDDLDALYRTGTVLLQQTRFDEAAAHYAALAKRSDLTLSDRIQAASEEGRARFAKRDYDGAERVLRSAITHYKDHKLEERLDSDYFLAQAAYLLGQISHEQFRLLPIRLPESRMQQDLELKAQMLLAAQRRYLEAMQVNHVEWAVAAGFQIGALYREMYDAFLSAPVPPEAKGELREVYVDQLRKKIQPLLQKAVGIFERNVLMAERVGVKNEWRERSVAQLGELRALLLPGAPAAAGLSAPPAPDAPAGLDRAAPHTAPAN